MSKPKWSPLAAMVQAKRAQATDPEPKDPLAVAPLDALRRYFDQLRRTEGEDSPALRSCLQAVLYPVPGAEIPHDRRQQLLPLLGVPVESPRYLHQLVPRLAPAWFAPEVARRATLAHHEIDVVSDPELRFKYRAELARCTLVAFEEKIAVDSFIWTGWDEPREGEKPASALSLLGPVIRQGFQKLVEDGEAVDDLTAADAFSTLWTIYGRLGWFQVLQGNLGFGPDITQLPARLARHPKGYEYAYIDLEYIEPEYRNLGAYRTLGFTLALRNGAHPYEMKRWCARNAAWSLQVQLIECLDRQGRTEEATERLLSLRRTPKRDALLAARGVEVK